MIWWAQRRFRFQKRSDEDSNEESDKNFRTQFRNDASNNSSGENSDKQADKKFNEKSYENEEDKKWDGVTDNSCADVNFLQKMIQNFIFEQIAITEHRLIHFNVGLPKYQDLTQISLKVQSSPLKMRGENQFSDARMISKRIFVRFRKSVVCYYINFYR